MRRPTAFTMFGVAVVTLLVATHLKLRRGPPINQQEAVPLPEVFVTEGCMGILRGSVVGGTGIGEILARPWSDTDQRLSSWQDAMEAVGGREQAEGVLVGLPGRVASLCTLSQGRFIVAYVVGEQEYVALKNGERLTVIPGAHAFNATATGDDVFPCAIATVAGQQVWRCFAGPSAEGGSSAPLYRDWPLVE